MLHPLLAGESRDAGVRLMDWSVSNVAFYLCIAIAAVLMATDQAIKDSADIRSFVERNFQSANWSYVRYLPLLLLIVAGAIQLRRALSPSSASLVAVATHTAGEAITSPVSIPLASEIERATPAPSYIIPTPPIPPIVTSTLIKVDDQNDLGDEIAKITKETDSHCRGLIVRCPSVTCEDDGQALMAVLTRGGWDMPWQPTSHGWEHLRNRVVIHSKVDDFCAIILSTALYKFGIDSRRYADSEMRKADRVDIIIQSGK